MCMKSEFIRFVWRLPFSGKRRSWSPPPWCEWNCWTSIISTIFIAAGAWAHTPTGKWSIESHRFREATITKWQQQVINIYRYFHFHFSPSVHKNLMHVAVELNSVCFCVCLHVWSLGVRKVCASFCFKQFSPIMEL